MKAILSLFISGALVVSGFGQTRNVLVGTNNAVVQPTNFWSADADNARSGLGLGSAATNPSSAFQPSSATLSNLALGNGGSLTNLSASSIVGQIPSSNIPSVTFTGISGTLSIAQGGTSATNAANARQNLGSTTVGDALFIATNAAAARTAIGALATDGDATNLTNFPASLLRTNGNGAGLTNITAANITGTVALASNVTGTIAITNGGSGATTAGGARTNLGLGATWLTNTVASNFRTAVGLGASDVVFFNGLDVSGIGIEASGLLLSGSNGILAFEEESAKAQTRTNLGLGWSALTNTNTAGFNTSLYGNGTNPVLYNTNGEVVSPTNFWQVAPITTTFIESQPTTNSTTNIAAARFLHIHSLATNIVNVTNTVVLPTNGATFDGDIALVVHQGPTSSMTRVRTAGSTNDLVTMTRFDEAVEFVYYDNIWQFNHNQAFIEPIYFSGTNASANIAASLDNLGLGLYDSVSFDSVNFTGTNGISFDEVEGAATTRNNLGLGWPALTNTNAATSLLGFTTNGQVVANTGTNVLTFTNTNGFEGVKFNKIGITDGIFLYDQATVTFDGEAFFNTISFQTTNDAAATRTNLGLGATWLTNTDVTNFRSAIGLGATNDVEFGSVLIGFNLNELYGWRFDTNGITYVTGFGSALWIGFDEANNRVQLSQPVSFSTTNVAATTRTNLGLGLPALTNTSNTAFQAAVFTTNTAPTNSANVNAINFNTAIHWMEVNIVTNNVTNSYRIPLFQ